MRQLFLAVMSAVLTPLAIRSQQPDWAAAHQETIAHLQAMIRMNTVNPPGNEIAVGRYLDSTLKAEGIETHLFEPRQGELLSWRA